MASKQTVAAELFAGPLEQHHQSAQGGFPELRPSDVDDVDDEDSWFSEFPDDLNGDLTKFSYDGPFPFTAFDRQLSNYATEGPSQPSGLVADFDNADNDTDDDDSIFSRGSLASDEEGYASDVSSVHDPWAMDYADFDDDDDYDMAPTEPLSGLATEALAAISDAHTAGGSSQRLTASVNYNYALVYEVVCGVDYHRLGLTALAVGRFCGLAQYVVDLLREPGDYTLNQAMAHLEDQCEIVEKSLEDYSWYVLENADRFGASEW